MFIAKLSLYLENVLDGMSIAILLHLPEDLKLQSYGFTMQIA